MSKQDYQAMALTAAKRVKGCYSRTSKRKAVNQCLDHLRESLRG